MNYQNIAVHTFTTKPWSISECIEGYAKRGIGGISIWRETVKGEDLKKVKAQIADAGLKSISLVRGGFFTGLSSQSREEALAENREALKEAAALGLDSIVLVCGATVGQTPRENYDQILQGVAALTDEAEGLGVKLLIEPLHPLYAGDRSGICSLAMANKICDELDHSNVGIAFDVYHVWWELDLEEQIQYAAKKGRLDTYHICDFKPDQNDILLDRGIMGEGCVQLAIIDKWMKNAGFNGMREVEIFSAHWWQQDQDLFLDTILEAHDKTYTNIT